MQDTLESHEEAKSRHVITIIAWQIIIIQPTSVVFGFEQFSLQFLFIFETPKTVHRLKNIILIIQTPSDDHEKHVMMKSDIWCLSSVSELYTEIWVIII